MKIPKKIKLKFPLNLFYEVRDMGDREETIDGNTNYYVVLQTRPKLITKIIEKLLGVIHK